ncbi:hypothetical protein OC195_18225 [Priestia flexa]|nr:hypothetical protein OC195_18225 [Priestia flexa]
MHPSMFPYNHQPPPSREGNERELKVIGEVPYYGCSRWHFHYYRCSYRKPKRTASIKRKHYRFQYND